MTIQILSDHLWQSTLFAAVCWVVAAMLRRNRAAVRHWVWVAASLKFLLPFSVVAALVGVFTLPAADATLARDIATRITFVSEPFTQSDPFWTFTRAPGTSPGGSTGSALVLVWAIGVAIGAAGWARRRRAVLRVIRDAAPMTRGLEHLILQRLEARNGMRTSVRLVSSADTLEPGVFGYLRPVLFWPELLSGRLNAQQVEAIMAHELCHIRRRDNLLASMHMVVEVLFWFHPAVWFIGGRLNHERERACDEEVIAQCGDPRTYAETILKTCELCLEGPSPTYSGVTGPNLRSRIETILTGVGAQGLTRAQRAIVACGAVAACAWPLFLAYANAQSSPPDPRIEVSTVKRHVSDVGPRFGTPSSGAFSAEGTTVRLLVQMAYGIHHFQVVNAPEWVNHERFDVVAKVDGVTGVLPQAMWLPTVRALLADRFQLRVHRETREGPVYALVTEESGHKLRTADAMSGFGATGRYVSGTMDVPSLAGWLSWRVEKPVLDRTGLKGLYDIELSWTPDPGEPSLPAPTPPPPPPPSPPSRAGAPAATGPALIRRRTPPPLDPNGPSLFTAIREQLGLRLEPQQGPVEMLVIDRIERPTEN